MPQRTIVSSVFTLRQSPLSRLIVLRIVETSLRILTVVLGLQLSNLWSRSVLILQGLRKPCLRCSMSYVIVYINTLASLSQFLFLSIDWRTNRFWRPVALLSEYVIDALCVVLLFSLSETSMYRYCNSD